MLKTQLKFIITIALVLGLSISFQSLIASWQAPTDNPPGDNIDQPINTGDVDQVKLGGLDIGGKLGVTGDLDIVDEADDYGFSGIKVYNSSVTPSGSPGILFARSFDNHPYLGGVGVAGFDNAFSHFSSSGDIILRSGDGGKVMLSTMNGTSVNPGLVVLNNGEIGIGTVSPDPIFKLDVNGKIRMRAETTNIDSSDTVATKGYVEWYSDNNVLTQTEFDAFAASAGLGTGDITAILAGTGINVSGGDSGNATVSVDPYYWGAEAQCVGSTVLAGDGTCYTAAQIVTAGGGGGGCVNKTNLYVGLVANCNAGVVSTNPSHRNCTTVYIGYACKD